MDYARFDNQASQQASWATDQSGQMMQAQQQPLKPDPPLSQAQPIVYGSTPHQQPTTSYDVSVSWTSQVAPQNIMHVPQWSNNPNPVGHGVPMDPNVPQPDPRMHAASQHQQQSHYPQYSTIPANTTYWADPNLVNNQPQAMGPTSTGPMTSGLAEPDPSMIEGSFTIPQPTIPGTLPASGMAEVNVMNHTVPPQQHQQQTQYEEQVTIPTSSQVASLPSAPLSDGRASLEDALEVIKHHAENFSRQTCSSSSGDDDDDLSRGGLKNGERERERRQANNARER